MRDYLYEETVEIVNRDSANRKYNFFNFLSIFSYVSCVLWLIFFTLSLPIFTIDFFVFGILPNLILLLGGIFLGRARDGLYVEYDYRFLSGEVNISKVIKAKKRKKGIAFRCIDLERLGVYGSETFNKYDKIPEIKKCIMTSNVYPADNKDFYYAIFTKDDKKCLVILECKKQFITAMMAYSNKFVFDEELKKL